MKYADVSKRVATLAVLVATAGSARAEYTVPGFWTRPMSVGELRDDMERTGVELIVRDSETGEVVDLEDDSRDGCRVVFDPATRGTTIGDGGQLRVTSVCTTRRAPPRHRSGGSHDLRDTLLIGGSYALAVLLGILSGAALTRSKT